MARRVVIGELPLAARLFAHVGGPPSFLWLAVRLWLGWQWLSAGWGKVSGAGAHPWGRETLRAFWERAVVVPEPPARPAIAYDWYRSFLELLLNFRAESWMTPLIAWGELLVGLGLIAGAFTGIAAAAGAFMNMNFMLAGSASTNPLLFLAAVLLMLSWKSAGWWGADRYLLPRIGTPWSAVRIVPEHLPSDPSP